jgi:uncharacterized coiled-coil DUF342 family protein
MAEETNEFEKIQEKIKNLETNKADMIGRIRYLTRRMRFKKFEQKALAPFLEQTKDVRIAPLRKKRNRMEFMIATAAYTPRMEREWLKEVRKLDAELEKVKEIEKARRKKRFVDEDIESGEKEIKDLEKNLSDTKDRLRRLYDEAKSVKMATRRSVAASAAMEDEMVSLGDLAMIDDKKPKKD